MADEEKKVVAAKADKAPKLADPIRASIDPATQQMIARDQELGIDTVFDRAEAMKPCAIGVQGICCKNCSMGPCRLPLPKGGIEGEDTRKGLCGASANSIAARNFIRMIAGGASAEGEAARVVVHDAWWEPPAGGRARSRLDGPFSVDTITVHHPDWYQRNIPPADWDSPTPLQHLCAVGLFLFAVEAPDASVARFVQRLLSAALSDVGVGGRTRKGYGRFLTPGQAPAGPRPGSDAGHGAAPTATPTPVEGSARIPVAYDPGRRQFRVSVPMGSAVVRQFVDAHADLFGGDAGSLDAFVKECRRRGSVTATVRWTMASALPKVTRIERD